MEGSLSTFEHGDPVPRRVHNTRTRLLPSLAIPRRVVLLLDHV